jgi:hypothetical protein
MRDTLRFFGWKVLTLLAVLATDTGCTNQTARRGSAPLPGLIDTDKPATSEQPDLLARTQPALPEHFAGKEMAYIENHIAPTPAAAESVRGFILFSRPITRAVYRASVPEAHERLEYLTGFATPGEYEPLSFSVYALRDILNMRVELSDLRCGTSRISADRLDLRLVTEWAMRYPRYTSDTWRRIPELLEKVTASSFASGTCQRYWLTLHTPEDAQPGLYSGCATICDDLSGRAVRLPILFRVLNFRLLRDPAKRYSVYAYDLHQQLPGREGERLERAMQSDYAAMRAYGIDMFPTIPLMETRGERGEPEVAIRNPHAIDAMIAAGFQGPIPLIGGVHHFYQTHVPGGTKGSHWVVDKFPANDAIYEAVEHAFRKLRAEFERRGWPEPVVCPMDEVAASSADFAARIYAAIRRAGLRTYITKDPDAPDAEIYRRLDAVDIWCSQPFSMPYDKAVSDTRYGYWSYPNHNAGEMKDREVMQRGGRMTYGFGLWRSGYTALIPWHWRWTSDGKDPFDYLASRQSGCGTRIDEADEVIPTVYWSCFREGYDDARYLYTLQQALDDRRDLPDPRVRQLVSQGQRLLQEVWDTIPIETRYLAHNTWPDTQFGAVRWSLASLTSELLRIPAAKCRQCPSVLADPAKTASGEDPFETAKRGRTLSSFDLLGTNTACWQIVGAETSREILTKGSLLNNRPVLRMTVKVDHQKDGTHKDGPYPVGWPRLFSGFASGTHMLDAYDFLVFRVNVDSDRDEVADDATPFTINFAGYGGGKIDVPLDLGDVQREWRLFRIPLRGVLDTSPAGRASLNDLKHLQLVVNEANYAHGTTLHFDFDELALVRLTRPVLNQIRCPSTVLVPAERLPISISFLGATAALELGCQIHATLLCDGGTVLAMHDASLSDAENLSLDLTGVPAGTYTLSVRLVDQSGQTQSECCQPVTAVSGYWVP